MTRAFIRKAEINEFGIYEDGGAIVLGFRLAATASFETLIFQIDIEGSDQRQDQLGMYTEFDGNGIYGAVRQFNFEPQIDLLDVVLDPKKSQGHNNISIELPRTATFESRELLAKMAEVFRDYPPTNAVLANN
jgi:hypothetical protein